MTGLLGGYSDSKDISPEVKEVILGVKPEVEKHLSESFHTFEPHSVKTQVVSGTNYKAKVHVGDDKYVHVTVFQPLPHTKEPAKVVEAHGGKGKSDAL